MNPLEAVAEMKAGKLARPVTWRGTGVWMEYRSSGQVRGFVFFNLGHSQHMLTTEEALGEWEVCAWDRKSPIANLPA